MNFYDVFYKDENNELKSSTYYVSSEKEAENLFRDFDHKEDIIKIEIHKRKE